MTRLNFVITIPGGWKGIKSCSREPGSRFLFPARNFKSLPQIRHFKLQKQNIMATSCVNFHRKSVIRRGFQICVLVSATKVFQIRILNLFHKFAILMLGENRTKWPQFVMEENTYVGTTLVRVFVLMTYRSKLLIKVMPSNVLHYG